MASERCTQCGTARRGDLQVCVKCEAPFAAQDPDIDLQRPAAPSKVQTHGTMAVAVVLGVVLMGVLFAFSVRDVGPFTGQITGQRLSGAATMVSVRIDNAGDRGGKGNCRLRVLNQSGVLTNGDTFLTETIPGKGSVTQDVSVAQADGKPSAVICS